VWTGGLNYLRNLLSVLDAFAAERVRPVVMVPAGVSRSSLPFHDIGSVELAALPAALSGRRPLARARAILLGRDAATENWLRKRGIDVVFETTDFLGRQFDIPALAWIPDFQHRHLPGMFEPSRRWGREILYQLQTRCGRTVMLSSESARRDCELFYPASRGRTVVVRFAVPAPADPPDDTLTARYALPVEFFYLPNQFWKHKNHGVIIEALRLLRQQGSGVVVIASGNPSDVRNPTHYSDLAACAAAFELGTRWRVLGMIPRVDVRRFMRASVAVVNPSLCEGWSTTVEEAKSLQVPLVLSDLAVHREQAAECAEFFDPSSAADAARALTAALARFRSLPRGPARPPDPRCDQRLRAFAAAFCDAAELAIARHRSES